MPEPDQRRTLLINDMWKAADDGRTREVVNPFDASVLTHVAEAGPAEADRAVRAAQTAFDNGRWSGTFAAQRAAVLRAVAEDLQTQRDELARLETLDTGKTLAEAGMDVDDATAVLRYYADLITGESGREVDPGRDGVSSRIRREPVGVCALITPWNYPLLQITWKVAPALAAGSTLVAKPSELTPLTTIRLFEFLQARLDEAGAPGGVVNLVLGSGVVGAALAEHPGVDLVSFTGGLATGRSVMRAAADTVKRVALELGGKNPNIVLADADIPTALDYALTAAFLHSGQVCSAGSRLLLHRSLHEEFVTELAARADRIRLGNGLDQATETGPLVSAAHRQKVERHIATALTEGAALRAGGSRPTDPDLKAGYFLRPTVFDSCHADMAIVREEVFGPVLTIELFDTTDEAVTLANDTPYGLAAAVWTADSTVGDAVANRLRAGTVWINDYHPYVPAAEWGGYKQSGVGRELGPSGLHEYQETKHVWQNLHPAPQRWFSG